LIQAHLPLVRSVARRYLGRGETLDDLVQIGSIGLIKSSDRFDPSRGVAFATFATPAVEGEIRRHLARRRSSLWELQHADGADSTAEVLETESLSRSHDRLLLAGSVESLDERERQIVFLRFEADLTERQIGHVLGISQAHVSRLLGRALAKLREALAETRGSTEGDTSSPHVISPPVGANQAIQNGSIRPNPPVGETRIADMTESQPRRTPESQPDETVERYLELSYHLAVRLKRNGQRSWWSATVEELPGCGAQGSTADEAVRMLRAAMQEWMTAALAEGREIPMPSRSTSKPKDGSAYSGRFLVRMPSTLHEQLVQAAERDDTSLNRYVTDVLARAVTAPVSAQDPEPAVAQGPPAPTVTESVSPSPKHDESASPATQRRARSPRPTAHALQVALATNLVVVVLAALIAVALLVLALQRGV
jgi:RNA polymerase sigma-B factor